jgi:cell division protein FtsI (penicillin-binding protein 3)
VLGVKAGPIASEIKTGKEKGRRFAWIARKLDEDQNQAVNKAFSVSEAKKTKLPAEPGLYWRKEQKREYPLKELAAQVIGFSDADDVGQSGIELSQESVLKGEIVKKWRERDRLGRVYDEEGIEREPPRDIVLTIDRSIQYKTEEALAAGVKAANARSGKAIVLDPRNGEILAMANYPTFDPNEYGNVDPEVWRNRAVQDNFSPGSVMKMVTYSAAMEEGKISPMAMIDCGNGQLTVAGHTFNDSHAVGAVTYTKAFAQSSNVGAIKTGMKVGRDDFYSYVRKFGYGSKTGVELPAETEGLLRSPQSWNGDSLASMSIGYEIGVTALQTAVAFATIANDGVKVQPHILKEIRQSDGKLVSKVKPSSERVVGEATAREIRKMLREVVLNGTAKKAQLNGYSSAGKTGTAWKYDPQLRRVNREKYISSFVGFAPANDPRVVIAISIDEPRGALRYGGQVAGPIFKQIAEQVLPELNVLPDGTVPDAAPIVDELIDEPQLVADEPAASPDPAAVKEKETGDTPQKEATPADTRDRKAVRKTAEESAENKKKDAKEPADRPRNKT